MESQRLDQAAVGLIDTLADKYFSEGKGCPDILSSLEPVLPGVSEKFKSIQEKDLLKSALSPEIAQFIKSLMEQGTEESLSAAIEKVRELRGLVEGSSVSSNEGIQTLITQSGGIFIGKVELVKLGKLSAAAEIPKIPEKYSQAFLSATHPIRGGTIASHIILAFDPDSNQWHCIDRGDGGKSDIVPGSLGTDGHGLSGDKQDYLLENVSAEGVRISSPADSCSVKRILDNAIAKHLIDGKSIETVPFKGIWGRTADGSNASHGCRVLLGYPLEFGSLQVSLDYLAVKADRTVGLLAGWY